MDNFFIDKKWFTNFKLYKIKFKNINPNLTKDQQATE